MPDTVTKHYDDWKMMIDIYFGAGAIINFCLDPPPVHGTFLSWASTPYSPHRFFFESDGKPDRFHNDFPKTNQVGQLQLGKVVRFNL